MRKTTRVHAVSYVLNGVGLKTGKVPSVTLFCFLAMMLFGSCGGLHVFNTTHTPNLTSKGEGNANAYLGSDRVEFQMAYSPINHLAVLANGYSSYDWPYYYNTHLGTTMGEAAVGYYHSLRDNTDKTNKWYFDAFAGYGRGARNYSGDSEQNKFDLWTESSVFKKTFLQSSVYLKHKRVDLGIAVQGDWIYFDSFNLLCNYSPPHTYAYGQPLMNIALQNRSVYNLNVALTYKYHVGNWALVIQFSGNITDKSDLPLESATPEVKLPNFNDRPIALTCGLEFDFGRASLNSNKQ